MKYYLSESNYLKGLLGEIYAKLYLYENGMAYVSAEEIAQSKKRLLKSLVFYFGPRKITIEIPKILKEEILFITRPHTQNSIPRYTFDFLACKINPDNLSNSLNESSIDDFLWIEAKSGNSPVSMNQIISSHSISIPVKVCRAEGVWMNKPENVGIEFKDMKI